jgi:eukaryotic-like serine/threonine-protein kinase
MIMEDDPNQSDGLQDETQGDKPDSSPDPFSKILPKNQGTTVTQLPPAQQSLMIGNYKIIREIGSGGMGVVYEAEQQRPKRLVALKVIQGGRFVDEHQIKLFEREAQALARLKHPGIAAIYESGRTPDGRHFFAMELVRGDTLEVLLKKSAETGAMTPIQLRERLAIFRKISDAITYAHQRGVIHRDLKPSNIIIHHEFDSTDSGTEPRVPGVKILDFGLARITETDLAVATIGTEIGKIQGTLPYMSPEQVRGNPDEIDVRSDIYSLGVILYEMISGRRPYDVHHAMLHEAARIICEVPPDPLSKSWSGTKRLDRDLETIVGKALEKEALRRYQNVSALGEDISRFLAGQPILARAPSAMYQLRKMALRHKLGFAFAALLLVLIAVFSIGMSIQAQRIARERDRANQEAEVSRQVSDFLTGLFKISDPSVARGNSVTAREILDKGADKITHELQRQPLVQGKLMNTMGSVYVNLGLFDPAQALLENALVTRTKALGQDHPDVADTLNQLGNVAHSKGDFAKSKVLLDQALAIREKSLGPETAEVASSLLALGGLNVSQGNYGEARRLLERSLAIREKILGPEHEDVATTLNSLGAIAFKEGDLERAEAIWERTLAIREKVLGQDHPVIARSLSNLAIVHIYRRDPTSAVPLLERAVHIQEKVLGPKHPDLASGLSNLGDAIARSGDVAGSKAYYSRAVAIMEEASPDNPQLARFLDNLAYVLRKERDLGKAKELYERSLALRLKALGPKHPEVGESLGGLADCAFQGGRLREAEALYEKALVLVRKPDGSYYLGAPWILEGYAALLKVTHRDAQAAEFEAQVRQLEGR